MYFRSDAYSQLYPRSVDNSTPVVESMVENFEPDIESNDQDIGGETDVGEGTNGTTGE